MKDAELIGGVLYDKEDPIAAGQVLVELLTSTKPNPELARSVGLDTVIIESLRKKLPGDPESIEVACARGVGWVLGSRSHKTDDFWEAVASLPVGVELPEGLRHTTGETLIGLVSSSQVSLRMAAPYIDEAGIGFLINAIVAATKRLVNVELFYSQVWEPARAAIAALTNAVNTKGVSENLHVFRATVETPFAHLKVMVVDGSVAYVGSANITAAGLAGRNLELGILVRGSQASVIDAILDIYRERAEI